MVTKNNKVIIVDGNDSVIGVKDRIDISHDIFRVSALWLTNDAGDALIARRALSKWFDPGKWAASAAGMNDEGESYDENMIKEASEELGIRNVTFDKGPKIKWLGVHRYFCQWYFAVINKAEGEFEIQTEEVAEIKWFSEKELQQSLRKHPSKFTPSALIAGRKVILPLS